MTAQRFGARRRAYRRGQTIVLFALATLVAIACAAGPLYERAVEQATVHSTLLNADPVSRGLSLETAAGAKPSQVPIPADAKHLFGTSVGSVEIPVGFDGSRFPAFGSVGAALVNRDGECQHLTFVSGNCPTQDQAIAISQSAARVLHLAVGDVFKIGSPNFMVDRKKRFKVTVAGVYKLIDSEQTYWFGHTYSSRAGAEPGSLDSPPTTDAVFGSTQWVYDFAEEVVPQGVQPRYLVDVPLAASRVRVSDLGALRATLAALKSPHNNVVTTVNTGLAQLLDQIDKGRSDARKIVIAVASQLALLAVLTLGVVVAAAADQRRPELALARLRGRSRAATTLVFLREIGLLATLAIIPGLAIAWGLTALACHVWLVPGVSPELRWPTLAGLALALVVILIMVAAIGLRASRQPITTMLRQVQSRVARAGITLAEVGVAVAAIAGLVGSGGGKHGGILATLTPTLVAVLVGLVLARVLALVARSLGRRSFNSGAIARSLAMLGIARRGGARLAVTVLCVATALAVFAGQQWSVADGNRHERAAAEVGAAVALDVSAPNSRILTDAVRAADPSQRYASAVATVVPPGVDAGEVLAVQPASFAHVAAWGRTQYQPSAGALQRLESRNAPPAISFKGTQLHVQMSDSSFDEFTKQHTGAPKVQVRFDMQRADGGPTSITSPVLPLNHARTINVSEPVECTAGCRIVGMEIIRGPLDSARVHVSFVITKLFSSGAPGSGTLRVGKANDWGSVTPSRDPMAESMQTSDASNGLHVVADDDNGGAAMQYLDVPIALPILLSGRAPDTVDELGYATAPDTSGGETRIHSVGRIKFVPGTGTHALIVNFDQMALNNAYLDSVTHPAVWLASDDPARESALVAKLKKDGIFVLDRTTKSQRAAEFTHSAPGWSAELNLAAAVLSALLALALLILIVVTSRRERQQDLSALLLTGLPRKLLRRATVLEIAILAITGLIGGIASGIAGVQLSLRVIPVFIEPATVPIPVTYPVIWIWLAGSIVLSAGLLLPAAVFLGRRVVARSRPDAFTGATL